MDEIKKAGEESTIKKESRQFYSAESKRTAKLYSPARRDTYNNEIINLDESSDEQLARNFLESQNEEVFNELVNRYTDKIYRLALRITHHHADAEEVLQEVFLNLIEKLCTFREESKLSTWLYRIAINTSLMYLRVEKRYRSYVSLDDYVPHFEDGSLKGVEIKDWSKTPDEVTASNQTMKILEKAIGEMPEKYRIAFQLRDVEGLSNQEVAEILGLTIPAAKSRISRSRLFLRDRLSDYFDERKK